MSAPLLRLLAFALACVGAARADTPPPTRIVYDLSVGGQAVGTREVTIRYLPQGDGERRVIEAYTDATIAGHHVACRSTGSSSDRGATFTSAIDQDGAVSQVQGIELPDGGWRVIVADASGVRETTLGRGDVRVTTMDVLDPGRSGRLAGEGALGLLLVESGDVLAGTIDAGQVGNSKVAGQKVVVTRYTVDGGAASAKFDIDANGFLVKSEVQWLGGAVVAAARELPPPRSYGTIDAFDPLSTGVSEDRL